MAPQQQSAPVPFPTSTAMPPPPVPVNQPMSGQPRQRTASKPFAAPAPASAPSIGSGAACATCQKWIGGRVVHAMSHTFHPDCFVCSHCSEALEHVAFYEHEGRPYCHFDFHELFSKRCFHCRTPIVDQRYITINDVELVGNDGTGETQERCYHDMHFFCANCGDPFLDPKLANGHVRFGGREFVVHKGYPYCEHCHVSLHKPRCKGCKNPIIDEEYLTALRGKWHIGCFCCERCQHPIDSDNFFVRDGQAYDEECYKIKLRSEL
ncbi:LIM-domain-containing protein [Meira miltonrushii]|uniref:LIM-domain-containing protein n=1 Tax=Meira miltonrushii TaxID=1280837 RepID=A0A316VIT1_9BASI|nr:LIM-domain-containing protein [Meira miltonrushii]PWN35415.1 LIM-domain-containing protein [Meira miltonrushii]